MYGPLPEELLEDAKMISPPMRANNISFAFDAEAQSQAPLQGNNNNNENDAKFSSQQHFDTEMSTGGLNEQKIFFFMFIIIVIDVFFLLFEVVV